MAAHAATPAQREPVQRTGGASSSTRPLGQPWALALAVAIPLTIVYLVWAPPAADLSAAIYRSDLFARGGYALRDNGWYAVHGHYLLGYSLLSPGLGALLGVRALLASSALAASVLFGLIAERAFGLAAGRAAAVVFAFGICGELLSGRVPYDLGFAIGLGAVFALMRARFASALVLAVLTSVSSPIAGLFLALAFLAWALSAVLWREREQEEEEGATAALKRTAEVAQLKRGLALMAATLAPILVLTLAFPEGGYEPFASSALWPALGGVLLIALLLPRGPLSLRAWRSVRVGAALYALALIGSFAISTPVGGNAARLGPPLAAPLLTGVLWGRRRVALCLLAPVLLYWQLNTPIGDLSLIAGGPSANASYYAPLLSELRRLRGDRLIDGAPTIVEVPLTATHAEAAYVAGHDHVSLARGWERQLDTRYGALFYRPTLTASAYRAWLRANRVVYVALPDARLDYAGRAEGALVARGLPYLREVWRSRHWRLYQAIV